MLSSLSCGRNRHTPKQPVRIEPDRRQCQVPVCQYADSRPVRGLPPEGGAWSSEGPPIYGSSIRSRETSRARAKFRSRISSGRTSHQASGLYHPPTMQLSGSHHQGQIPRTIPEVGTCEALGWQKPLRRGYPDLRAPLCARPSTRCCSLSMVDDASFWKAIRTDSMPDSNASLH